MHSLAAAFLVGLCAAAQHFLGNDLMPHPSVNMTTPISGTVISDLELVNDCWDDDSDRSLMVTIYRPITGACHPAPRRYMPPTTVEHMQPLLSSLGLEDMKDRLNELTAPACYTPDETESMATYPVLLFSHGLNSSRLLSGLQAQAVAMNGYTVITIDHPGTARVVTWLNDTTTLSANFSTNELIDDGVRVRMNDLEFVRHSLDDEESELYRFLNCHRSPLEDVDGEDTTLCNGTKIAMFGHSLGGATGLLWDYDGEEGVKGIANLDGYPYGFNTTGPTLPDEPIFKLPDEISHNPGLLFNMPNNTNAKAFTDLFARMAEGSLQLELKDARHWTFTDLSVLIDHFGMRDRLSPAAIQNIGSLGGDRAMSAIVHYLVGYFDWILKGVDVLAPSKQYPEVRFARPEDGGWKQGHYDSDY